MKDLVLVSSPCSAWAPGCRCRSPRTPGLYLQAGPWAALQTPLAPSLWFCYRCSLKILLNSKTSSEPQCSFWSRLGPSFPETPWTTSWVSPSWISSSHHRPSCCCESSCKPLLVLGPCVWQSSPFWSSPSVEIFQVNLFFFCSWRLPLSLSSPCPRGTGLPQGFLERS